MRDLRRALTLAVLLVAAVAAPAIALERPPPLTHLDGCELWRGTVSGNDPSVLTELRLCPSGADGLVGKLQWSSTTSGYSIREVEGTRRGTHVELHDTRFAQYRPAGSWRFCLVDHYRLDQNGDHLDGSYDSAACRDHARVTLTRVAPHGTP
jgi:hypothetical protein